ncbi:CRP-like cAMP-binding protein [Micromonospora pisi]|uniref:CRP-like cAMP-binding protein n=1 Tax=Micromonospora pisi TaxID=589240 RepID=A0A495JQ15_9ACTN|nr:Crp/Fnr family transcriptional regulator [Micromonospora pisi]RKR90472.1 CRP-like cAMP-binding protein [Micromonospora pisi]
MPVTSPAQASFVDFVPPADWAALATAGQLRRLPAGRVLFLQEATESEVLVLLSGSVKVFRTEMNGHQSLIGIRLGGDLIGEMAALNGTPRSAGVAVLRPVEARVLTAERFNALITARGLDRALHRYHSARVRESDEQRVEIALLPVRQRLARTLLRLAHRKDGDENRAVLDLGLPQDALGQLIGASRNAVVAELTLLRKAGVLRTEHRRMYLTDLARLAEIGYELS